MPVEKLFGMRMAGLCQFYWRTCFISGLFLKNSDSVLNEFGLVLLKKRSTHVIAEQLIYSLYYSDSGWHDLDVTHNNDNK